jgi:hypothetical protein
MNDFEPCLTNKRMQSTFSAVDMSHTVDLFSRTAIQRNPSKNFALLYQILMVKCALMCQNLTHNFGESRQVGKKILGDLCGALDR